MKKTVQSEIRLHAIVKQPLVEKTGIPGNIASMAMLRIMDSSGNMSKSGSAAKGP
jgi:hypothetical protein